MKKDNLFIQVFSVILLLFAFILSGCGISQSNDSIKSSVNIKQTLNDAYYNLEKSQAPMDMIALLVAQDWKFHALDSYFDREALERTKQYTGYTQNAENVWECRELAGTLLNDAKQQLYNIKNQDEYSGYYDKVKEYYLELKEYYDFVNEYPGGYTQTSYYNTYKEFNTKLERLKNEIEFEQ